MECSQSSSSFKKNRPNCFPSSAFDVTLPSHSIQFEFLPSFLKDSKFLLFSQSRNECELEQDSNAGAELQSRRSVVQTGGALGFLAALGRLPAVAEEDGEFNSTTVLGSSTATESKPKKSPVDTESWYRYRGEGFRMTIPPDYIDLVEYDVSSFETGS